MKLGWIALGLVCSVAFSTEADWSEGAKVPSGGRANPYGLAGPEIERGRLHTVHYPVEATAVLFPYKPMIRLLRQPAVSPFKATFLTALGWPGGIHSAQDLFTWLGMRPYPKETDRGVYSVPYPGGKRPTYPMGVTLRERGGAQGFSISCAACHAGNLFGKTVLGMTTRFPRANRLFHQAKRLTDTVPGIVFQASLFTSSAERRLYEESRWNLFYVDSRLPKTLGLDTSLAHTALSLARRAPDDVATKKLGHALRPDPEVLADVPADSKPSVWWTLKYKNRWLSDGSLVSGNPIYTNLLWNEIGRGVDLNRLEGWLDANPQVVRELTTAVFSSEAPKFTDFFPAPDREAAKRGEALFRQYCLRCHGHRETTPVVDVGTDPHRWQAMTSLARRLNPLGISRRKGIRIVPQQGYVPPPLEGIWARWPYFHNNSAPSLCAVLTRADRRPERYYAVEADDPGRDFDRECNGYPASAKGDSEKLYDTTKPGLANSGHDEGIFLRNGEELMTPAQKRDLIRYLQTL